VRLQLFVLLLVAAAAGLGAGTVPDAGADRSLGAAAYPGLRSPTAPIRACPIPPRYRGDFETASRDTGLPLSLLLAVAIIESSLQEHAVSPAGAQGLLQVMPETAQLLELNIDERTDNVLAGARYLSLMFDRFRSAELALAAYNAGPTAVENAFGAPPRIARPYVDAVMALWKRYSGCV
jgi:soluble lytic murein transglycosylase-like protein